MLRGLIAALIIVGSMGPVYAKVVKPIRLGLTAVVVRENLRFLDRWAEYLSAKMDRPVEFVLRRSYREEMDLLGSGDLDFAWICGFPYIMKRNPEFLELLVVPIYRGEPFYNSYIIVPKDSPYKTFDDLKGKVFAFSDPESNSGFLYPMSLLTDRRENPGSFFRKTFFTFNHAETVEAVSRHVADAGAVDSYIWEYLLTLMPDVAKKTRVIKKSPKFGFPPLVARKGGDKKMVDRMRSVLLGMKDDPEGRYFLEGLKLDGFGVFPPSLFDGIRKMAERVRILQPGLSGIEESGEEKASVDK